MRTAVLDIGGTSIKSGIIETGVKGIDCGAGGMDCGALTEMRETPANARLGGPYVVETAKKILEGYSDFSSIGISTAGQVDGERGIIRYANQNIPDYTGMEIKKIFYEAFQKPVAVENDVNAAALGEAVFGAGKDLKEKNFLCLTYGTGIGGAIVIDGKIFKGAAFCAGEFGFLITHGVLNGEEKGYYENYASTTALIKNVQTERPHLNDGRQICANLADPAVKKFVDDWIHEVLFGLAGLIHVFNPSLVILGGGVMQESYIINSLKEKISGYIMPSFAEDVVLSPALLGNTAGLWGAGYLAASQENSLFKSFDIIDQHL